MILLISIFINVSISAVILTFLENLYYFFVWQLLFNLILLFIFVKKIKYDVFILIGYNLIFSIILLISFAFKNINFLDKYQNLEKNKIFFSSGYIIDSIGDGKYIFEYNGVEFLLNSKKDLPIGSKILLLAKQNLIHPNEINLNFTGFNINFSFYKRYQGWLFMKDLYGVMYYQNHILLTGNYNFNFFQKIKNFFKQRLIQVYGTGKHAGLILGMTIGDKSLIPKQDYKSFINSGLVHIIAVSGANIMFIVIVLSFILIFVPFYIRLIIILITITIYAFVCGLDSSVFRALIMGGLSLIALFFGKDIWIVKLFLIAWILMIVINPYFLVYDLGFLLSFGALFGIIVASEFGNMFIKKQNLFNKKILKEFILPTIGASLGVFPILIFFTEKFNLINILANLFVIPIVPLVMINGIITSLFSIDILVILEKYLISYIYFISDYFSLNVINIQIENLIYKSFILFLTYFILIGGFIYLIRKNNV